MAWYRGRVETLAPHYVATTADQRVPCTRIQGLLSIYSPNIDTGSGCRPVNVTVHLPFPPEYVFTMISPGPTTLGETQVSFFEFEYSKDPRQFTPHIITAEYINILCYTCSAIYIYSYIHIPDCAYMRCRPSGCLDFLL